MANVRAFINAQVCISGKQSKASLFADLGTGLFVDEPILKPSDIVDLDGLVLAPSFLELQTNGCLGIHFTNFENSESYQKNLKKVSQHLLTQGVGAFYVTLPTVSSAVFRKVSLVSLCHFVPLCDSPVSHACERVHDLCLIMSTQDCFALYDKRPVPRFRSYFLIRTGHASSLPANLLQVNMIFLEYVETSCLYRVPMIPAWATVAEFRPELHLKFISYYILHCSKDYNKALPYLQDHRYST